MQEETDQRYDSMEKVPQADGHTQANGHAKATSREASLCRKVATFVSELRVEPIMGLYTLCLGVSQAFIQNVIIEKICLETGYSREVCESHINKTVEAKVQGKAAEYMMSLNLLRLVPAMVISIVIGHWSDKHGRKQILFAALCGNIITYVLYCINAVFIEARPIYMVLAAIPAGLTGDYTIIMFGIYSIVRDTTSPANLIVKIAVIDGLEQVASEIGPLIGAQLYSRLGYVSVFGTSIVLLVACFVYTTARIKETQFEVTSWKRSILDFFDVSGFSKNVMVLTDKREGHRRAYISANMAGIMLISMCAIGHQEIIYLYGRLVAGWDVMTYSYYTVYAGGLQALGLLIIMPAVVNFLTISDTLLVVIGCVFGVVWFIGTAFVKTVVELFGVRALAVIFCFALVSFRSIPLKCVAENEIGKITAVFSIAQTLGQILGRAVSTQIYVATLDNFPGAFFVFSAGIIGIMGIIFGYRSCIETLKEEMRHGDFCLHIGAQFGVAT